MIINELVVHNFGVYKGRHVFDLTPPSPSRPIVLIGGLNGGGKTTFLDAVQLALYGNRARSTDRERYSYEEYLKRLIHRDIPVDQGAAIELEFSLQLDAEQSRLRIHRSWRSTRGRAVREYVAVHRDGALDPVLTEIWSDYVEEFFPLEISQLFFFDGERIEALADPDQSGALIETAVHSLLGVDLIDRLDADLVTLERRQRSRVDSDRDTTQLDALQERLETTVAVRDEHVRERASLQTELDRTVLAYARADDEYRKCGGNLFERVEELEAQREQAAVEVASTEDELRQSAAGLLPLALVSDLVAAIEHEADVEEAAAVSEQIDAVLDRRSEELRIWAWAELDQSSARSLDWRLQADREARVAGRLSFEPYLRLSADGRTRIKAISRFGIESAVAHSASLLKDLERQERVRADADRRLAGVPDNAAIVAVSDKRDAARMQLAATEARLAATEILLERASNAIENAKNAFERELELRAKEDLAADGARRIASYSNRARDRLREFKSQVIESDVHRIETAVTNAFRTLVHKESLVERVLFVLPNYRIELRSKDGKAIQSDELSAGERQLLAVAMLWGLASVSGKEIPTMIDTPLGRLDSVHRERLARRYFPRAGHQVVLLSTDEEIDSNLHGIIADHIGRSYRLVFDDASQSTRPVPGYFAFEESAHAG